MIAALRRRALLATALLLPPPRPSAAESAVSSARRLPELSNSIIASRDTNVSPKEIYDHLRSLTAADAELSPAALAPQRRGRALDLGAGAGVSTQVLWDAGWREIEAVDPSGLAWERFCEGAAALDGVRFHQQSDERYVAARPATDERFDLVIINYAVNAEKAVRFARELLTKNGRLLAPTNVQSDFWFNQRYELLDARGEVLWTRGTLGVRVAGIEPPPCSLYVDLFLTSAVVCRRRMTSCFSPISPPRRVRVSGVRSFGQMKPLPN
jgi:SAM-dependent methyltransferase